MKIAMGKSCFGKYWCLCALYWYKNSITWIFIMFHAKFWIELPDSEERVLDRIKAVGKPTLSVSLSILS